VVAGPGPVIPEQPDDITSGVGQAPEIFPADDEHYEYLVEEADNLVIFLGAGANADDH
jgi:hypothetical protein